MTDKDTARRQVAELVDKYRTTPAKERDAFTEQQMRISFILPLFQALGWDIENPAEVSAEEQISRGFVDFGFYFNNVPAFYLETKRAAEKLERPSHMRQAINYAYLKGVTWAVLTDFSRLMVFNAEWETRDPIQARFLDLRCEDYDRSQFEDLWLLSRPAMQAREMDRVAERFGKKAKKEAVTKTLFKDLTDWRHALFNNIRGMKTTLWAQDPHKVDSAVQKLLDRLIFIRSVEDRGVEQNRLRALVRQSRPGDLFPALLKLFRELDGIYNSNLFAQSEIDLMELYDPGLLTEIIEGLYKAPGGFVDYDFNAISADVLGAVYEQYLGFRAQDPEARQAIDKRSKRKSQGIYYTPQFVVRYIVRQTVGKLLENGADPLSLRILDPACGSGSFLIEAFDTLNRHMAQRHPDATAEQQREWRRRILTECLYGVDLDDQAVEVTRLNLMLRAALERGKLPLLTNIKHGNSLVDDPAVAGDLAFKWEDRFPLVCAGRQRPLWFVTFVTHNSRISERMVTYGIQGGEPLIFSPEDQILIAEKIAEVCTTHGIPVVAWNVLPDHVHMVIGAEDEPTLNEYVRKIKGYSSYAFQRAVSDSGVSDSGLKPTVSNDDHEGPVWARKFNRQAITHQAALDAIIDYVNHNHVKHAEQWGNELLTTWEMGVPNTGSNKGLKPLVQIVRSICIPAEEAAHVPGGFDVVIGNPPYVRQETLGAVFKDFVQVRYPNTYAGTADLYVYFIEKGISLLREGGLYGVIVANKWMRAAYGKPLRRWLKGQSIEAIVDFGDLPVFEDTTTYPCIVVVRKSDSGRSDSGRPDSGLKPTVSPEHSFYATQVRTLEFDSLGAYVEANGYRVNRAALDDAGWSLAGTGQQAVLEKVRAAGVPLGEYIEGKIHFGIKTGLNEAFLIDSATRARLVREDSMSAQLIKPSLMGRDVKRYATPHNTQYIILMPSGWTSRTVGFSPLSLQEAWSWLESHYPAIASHLAPFAEAAQKRWDKGEFWWELRPCDYYAEFEKPKILFPDIAVQGNFALDENGFYCGNTTYFVPSGERYLLGILNSRLMNLVYKSMFSTYRGGYLRFFQQYVEQLPIRRINFDDPTDKAKHDRMVTLVERMLRLRQEHATAETALSDRRHELAEDIARTDQEIDALVYALYGLTDDEIAVVEGQ